MRAGLQRGLAINVAGKAPRPPSCRRPLAPELAPRGAEPPHLDAGGAPLDEVGRLALADALQALVHLCGHPPVPTHARHTHQARTNRCCIRHPLKRGLFMQPHLAARANRPPLCRHTDAPPSASRTRTRLGGVDVALDDVEDADVARVLAVALARVLRHHDVLGLQQPPHHVQHRRLAHRARRHLRRARDTTPCCSAARGLHSGDTKAWAGA